MNKFDALFNATCEKLGKNPMKFNAWLTFLNSNKMRMLNLRTRGIDKSTDVLSFPVEMRIDSGITELGDIVICKRIARRNKISVPFLYVHGLLHLLGYDHLNETDEVMMNNLTEEILDE